VRYRLMASYQGSPFEAGVGPTAADVVLFAACPPPEHLGFEPATGHWRKQLTLTDVDAVWESRPVGMFRGAPCMVLDDLGDRLHIAYLGHDGYQAEQLGYWQVDRSVYEVIAARTEVTDIVEHQAEYPRWPAADELIQPSGHAKPTPGPVADPESVPAAAGPGYPPAESSIYVFSAPAESGPGYLPSGPIGHRAGTAGPFALPDNQPAAQAAGVMLPAAADTPLPLEAAALAAAQASQSRRFRSQRHGARRHRRAARGGCRGPGGGHGGRVR
jgi:hypothetical protein